MDAAESSTTCKVLAQTAPGHQAPVCYHVFFLQSSTLNFLPPLPFANPPLPMYPCSCQSIVAELERRQFLFEERAFGAWPKTKQCHLNKVDQSLLGDVCFDWRQLSRDCSIHVCRQPERWRVEGLWIRFYFVHVYRNTARCWH